MDMIRAHPSITAYTAASDAVDHAHPLVRSTVAALRAQTSDAYTYAENKADQTRPAATGWSP
ncbi:transglutaminase, partial [Streptomyces zhihengii]